MNHTRVNIWGEGEYTYEAAYGFVPNIRTYIHDDDTIRDCMLVVPGGGYCMVVPPEAEIVAKEFYNQGMNVFVLTYTTDITFSVPLKKQPLNDISRAVRIIRSRAAKWKINPDKVVVCGFSAGAHVCGTLCVHYEDVVDMDEKLNCFSNRPDAAILSYPVITSGEFTHRLSMIALMGNEASREEYDYFSIEKNVDSNTPPCFLWQTVTDDLVPVENSYLMANALKRAGVRYAHYVFPEGHHGLSVSTEDFYRGIFGEEYTFEQLKNAVNSVRDGKGIKVSKQRTDEIMEQFFGPDTTWFKNQPVKDDVDVNPYPDVRLWPELARTWLAKI